MDVLDYSQNQIQTIAEKSRAVGTIAGSPFVKDFLDVIKLDYEIYDTSTELEKEQEVQAAASKAKVEKLANKKTRQEDFDGMLYNAEHL